MKRAMIVVNLKTYQQGREVLRLCRKIEKVSKDIVVGIQATDILEITRETSLKVYAQHVDAAKPGRNTGFILPEAVKADGAVGVMLNHSEHPLEFKVLRKTIERCKKLKLKTFVFVPDLKMAKKVEKLGVDFICWEPAELVGGKISVSSAKPDWIKKIGKSLKSKFLVGAGIHSRKDIEVAMKYGAVGVALSSAVTMAIFPGRVLRKLIGK